MGHVIGYDPPSDRPQVYAFGGVPRGQVNPLPTGNGADDGPAVGAQWAGTSQLLDQFSISEIGEDVHRPAQQLHPGGGGEVEVSDGDQATGRWYVHELSKRPSRSTLTIGVYHDRYVHEDDAWRFAVRRFDILYTGPPDLSGESFPFPTDV